MYVCVCVCLFLFIYIFFLLFYYFKCPSTVCIFLSLEQINVVGGPSSTPRWHGTSGGVQIFWIFSPTTTGLLRRISCAPISR